ncbi:MAG: glucose-1-phosphate adenylyltransferase [Calditrichaeota bacterium]|nr:glucose-1-phosphate adenylyltransferase [Calditrichota bacterium]
MNTLTLLMAGGRGERLYPLTKEKAKPAVTFGGIYRIIDFTLSNCLNSGIREIYLLTQYSSITLDRHIRSGWSTVFRHELGEFIESVPPQHRTAEGWYVGNVDAVYQNINLLERHKPQRVLLLSGDHVYKMNYRDMIAFHEKMGAEVTVAVVELDKESAKQMGVVNIGSDSRVKEFLEKVPDPPTIPDDPMKCLVSMGVYVFDTARLVREAIRDSKQKDSIHDFGRNVLPHLISRQEKVFAHIFKDENRKVYKYWRDIGTIDSYYDSNMDLISVEPLFNLYDTEWPIRTYYGQYPPAKTVFTYEHEGRVGATFDSIISPGCIISGGRVYRSILSPRVRINSYSLVTDSILMEGVEIGRGARVHRAIICDGVKIPAGMQIGVNPSEDAAKFTVTPRGITVIPEGIMLQLS